MRFCVGLLPIWRGTSTQNEVPAGHGSCRRGNSRGGDLQGVEVQQARLLPVEGEPGDGAGLGGCAPGQRRPGHPRRRSGVRVPVHRRLAPGAAPESSPGWRTKWPASRTTRHSCIAGSTPRTYRPGTNASCRSRPPLRIAGRAWSSTGHATPTSSVGRTPGLRQAAEPRPPPSGAGRPAAEASSWCRGAALSFPRPKGAPGPAVTSALRRRIRPGLDHPGVVEGGHHGWGDHGHDITSAPPSAGMLPPHCGQVTPAMTSAARPGSEVVMGLPQPWHARQLLHEASPTVSRTFPDLQLGRRKPR